MGRSTLSITGLMQPFHSLEEWYLTIPPGQFLKVPNPEFKLVFFMEGEVAMSVPGQPSINLAKGDAYSLSLPVVQTFQSLRPERDTRLHFLRLTFRWPASAETPPEKIGRGPEKRFEAALRKKLAGFQHFHHSLFGEHYPISRRILSEMEHQDEVSAWKVSGLCQILTASLLSSTPETLVQSASSPRRSRDAVIEHTLQYLQENCHETLTLDSIAWQVRLSGEHLARLFKQETGRTVFHWLDHFRTEKARNMLVTTEWPLELVARSCGYSSTNLLIRHFKQNTGHPPIAYRVKIQKGEVFSPSKFSNPPNQYPPFPRESGET